MLWLNKKPGTKPGLTVYSLDIEYCLLTDFYFKFHHLFLLWCVVLFRLNGLLFQRSGFLSEQGFI